MKNKNTFTKYIKQRCWPIIKKQAIILFSILFVTTITLIILLTLCYTYDHNRLIFYSIIAIVIMSLIISAIYDDYKNWKKMNSIHKRNNNYEK